MDAFICFKAAAEQGYGKAQFNVGVCYEKGRGVHKDREKVCIFYSTLTVSIPNICRYFSFCKSFSYFPREGSASLLASSTWGPQAGSVPPCKADCVQQGAAERRRAEHSRRFPGAGSHSRTHRGTNDDKPWPAKLTRILMALQNSLHCMLPCFALQVVMFDLQPWCSSLNIHLFIIYVSKIAFSPLSN